MAAAALFNGVGLTLVKQAPTMAITFTAFEVCVPEPCMATSCRLHPLLSPGSAGQRWLTSGTSPGCILPAAQMAKQFLEL